MRFSVFGLLAALLIACRGNESERQDVIWEDSSPALPPQTASHVIVSGRGAYVNASSELESGHERHSAALLMDEDVTTAWGEAEPGDGVGQWIDVNFGYSAHEEAEIDGFVLQPGYAKSVMAFVQNAVPRRLDLYIDDSFRYDFIIAYDVEFHDAPGSDVSSGHRGAGCYRTEALASLSPRLLLFNQPVRARNMRLAVAEAMAGSASHDLCISEWTILLANETAFAPGVNISVRRIVSQIRDSLWGSLQLGEHAPVEDLRRKYVPRDPGKGVVYFDSPPADSAQFFARVPLNERGDGNTAYDKFFRYTRSSFIDAPVMVYSKGDKTYLIGALAASYGDSEWLEFYPTIVLNEDYEIIELKELVYADAAPGCHNVIPEIE